jgi:hypothetical protein
VSRVELGRVWAVADDAPSGGESACPNSACGLSSGRGCSIRGSHTPNLHKKAGGVAAEEQEIPEVLLGFLYDHNSFPPHPLAQLDGLSARCQEEPEVDASRKRRYFVHLVDCKSEALFAGEEPGTDLPPAAWTG